MARERERLKGNLDLLLLSVLAAGVADGWPTRSSWALRERSEGAFDLPQGNDYPAINPGLEGSGLLASSWG